MCSCMENNLESSIKHSVMSNLYKNKMLNFIAIVCFLLLCSGYCVLAQSRTNFEVKRLDNCESDGRVQYSFNVTKPNHEQYLDASMVTSIPFDGKIGMNIVIESAIDGRTFFPLFTIREKDFCKAMNKYVGELWYDIELAAQLPVGVCPIREGRYRAHHVLLNFKKMTLQTFPFGSLKFTVRAIEARTNKIVFCVIMEVENFQK